MYHLDQFQAFLLKLIVSWRKSLNYQNCESSDDEKYVELLNKAKKILPSGVEKEYQLYDKDMNKLFKITRQWSLK